MIGAVGGAIAGFLAVPLFVLIAGTTYSLIGGLVASLFLGVALGVTGGMFGNRILRR